MDGHVWIPVREKLTSPAKVKPGSVQAAACMDVSRTEFASGRNLRGFRFFFSSDSDSLHHPTQLRPALIDLPYLPSSAKSWRERTCP